MKTDRYFISYLYRTKTGEQGVGNSEITTHAIFSYDDIDKLEEKLRINLKVNSCIIINWKKFDEVP